MHAVLVDSMQVQVADASDKEEEVKG